MHLSNTQKKLLIIFLPLLFATEGRCQIGNLLSFDDKLIHFGIQIGYTQSKFDLIYTEDDDVRSVLQGATSYYNAGFHIAVIGDLRINRYLNLRFLPGLTLITRKMDYAWEPVYFEQHPLLEPSRTVESVYGDLPLEIKFRAWRWNNFRPYVTAGGCYGFDFASLRKNKNNTEESIIRLNSSDLRYTIGVGVDVFLHYIKFAIEMKMSFGLLDLEVPDNELYTQSVNGMKSRTFMLGFTFEGANDIISK